MKGRPKDGGILYHYNKHGNNPGIRHEFQIHEGDIGSYWAKNTVIDVPAKLTSELPESIVKATPYLKTLVSTLKDTMLMFDEEAPLFHFEGKNEWQIVLANPLNEKPAGEWNTLELICYGNNAAHIVNGKLNMIILNSHYVNNGQTIRHKNGSIQLQSEGAEIFFKDVQLKKIYSMPDVFKKYLIN